MNFEYNGNLEEKDRQEQVIKEIISYYPEITEEQARIISTLEGYITTNYTLAMHFKRLFNILFVIRKDKQLFNKVYKDIIKVYNLYIDSIEEDYKIDYMMTELIRYINGDRFNFPIISEFYE